MSLTHSCQLPCTLSSRMAHLIDVGSTWEEEEIPLEAEQELVKRLRLEDSDARNDAWTDLIGRYEGRLLAYVSRRLQNRSEAEDIIQEAFIGFSKSLPNYDGRRPLESYLFSIASHKLTDHLRREGRRPTIPLSGASSNHSEWQLAGNYRAASSIARSEERRSIEEHALRDALKEQEEYWRKRKDWLKIMCLELIIVRGWSNKKAAEQLGISQQKIASIKHEFVKALIRLIRGQGLPEEVFPELYDGDESKDTGS